MMNAAWSLLSQHTDTMTLTEMRISFGDIIRNALDRDYSLDQAATDLGSLL